ncbi:unnamed protein product [Prorocentrum cordatum]|uniref:TNFR-Cys domain-containing protein n=1 Tax=Prorocentrum cordatum TaxID=2364126 RepID=A0ABN9T810_9DINO|nr:unnamed protein product [Polarella glacialis]|mmetsp:Transcript_30429/g.86924  ORF Transcript_30429/g.86924 Transcript_30429/m.86924 type:complete len:474 (-) Transcript_30429:391-1812(-)
MRVVTRFHLCRFFFACTLLSNAQPGCNSTLTHQCSCGGTEAVCTRIGTRTTGCMSCNTTYGCYDSTTHQCSCGGSETECSNSGRLWTDQCSACATTEGCYDSVTHQCSCGSTKTECISAHVWSDQCTSCAGGTGDFEELWGCYDHIVHKCDCSIDVDTCDDQGRTWTSGCNSCAQETTGEPIREGCYSLLTHECDCESTETGCEHAGDTWTQCTSCGEGTDQTSDATARTLGSALICTLVVFVLLPAPSSARAGCYDHIDTHTCDCSVDLEHCEQVRGHIWTDGCRTCDASLGVDHAECNREHSWGCFDHAEHACDCWISQVACNLNMSTDTWTHQCWSCCWHSVWGCFEPSSGCLCRIPEGACTRDFPAATWSFRCHECEGVDPEPDTDKQQMNIGHIVIACAVSLSLCCAASLCAYVVVYWARIAKVKSMSTDVPDTVYGNPVQPLDGTVVVGVPPQAPEANGSSGKVSNV